jgi:hypothetical protein
MAWDPAACTDDRAPIRDELGLADVVSFVPPDVLLHGRNPSERPERLYHFTTCRGLIGVLRSRRLRASLATSLNDQSEVWYGVQRARQLVDTLTAGEAFRHHLRDALDARSEVSAPAEPAWRVYVVSFCAHADRAPHWLHYGQSGTGVAIGFMARHLETTHFDLYPVVYDGAAQDELIRRVFESAWMSVDEALGSAQEHERDALMKRAAAVAVTCLWLVAPRIKNPAFEAEDEWRLIGFEPTRRTAQHLPLRTHFRSAAGRVVPYKIVEYDDLPVCDILLGASAPMLPHDQALAVLAEETIGKPLTISRSEVPVRQ